MPQKFRPLWGEAIDPAPKGWLEGPFEITNHVRLAVAKMITPTRILIGTTRKLRACGDLWTNVVILCTSVVTPITLPTWGHIDQLIKSVYRTKRKWPSLNPDQDSSYIQLLFDPDFACLTVVTL